MDQDLLQNDNQENDSRYMFIENHRAIVLFIAFASASIATCISILTIFNHLRHYGKPHLQRYIVRILVIVPMYSILSWLSLALVQQAIYFDTVRDCYEAFVVYSFLQLILAYCGGEGACLVKMQQQQHQTMGKEEEEDGSLRSSIDSSGSIGKKGDGYGLEEEDCSFIIDENSFTHSVLCIENEEERLEEKEEVDNTKKKKKAQEDDEEDEEEDDFFFDDIIAHRKQEHDAEKETSLDQQEKKTVSNNGTTMDSTNAIISPSSEPILVPVLPLEDFNHPWPFVYCFPTPLLRDGRFLRQCTKGTIQFVIIKPIFALLSLIMLASGHYNDTLYQLILSIIYNVSYSLALYCLLLFYLATKSILSSFHPILKFFAVKSVVFLTFWQSSIIEILPNISNTQASTWKDFILCMEMVFFAIVHSIAYSPKEFQQSFEQMPEDQVVRNIKEVLSVKDIVADAYHNFMPSYQEYILQKSSQQLNSTTSSGSSSSNKHWKSRHAHSSGEVDDDTPSPSGSSCSSVQDQFTITEMDDNNGDNLNNITTIQVLAEEEEEKG